MIFILLRKLASKNGVIVLLLISVLLVAADAYRQRQEVNKIRAVYQNPQIKTVEKIVKVEGPVRIITRIVARSTGETETTIDETRAPVSETNERTHETGPVPVSLVMTPVRTDRYLVTFGVNRLTPDLEGKAFLVGYGFKNRLDLTAGVVHAERNTGWVFATLRF